MKKLLITSLVLLTAMIMASCGSTGGSSAPAATQERKVDSRMPPEVRDAIRNTPEDVLVGIGVAKMRTINESRTQSTNRARAEISRQLDTIIQDMIRDYTAGSEVDPSASISFQENITTALSRSRLQGSSIVDQIDTPDGSWWTIVMLNKTSAAQEINQAAAAAKLAVPAMASFNAEDRMNAAFDKYTSSTTVGYAGD
jgi:hypothetical protein